MNFANLTGLSDGYGNVTQIADAAGRVIWSAVTNKPVILQVEKITSDTYAGETTYTGEQFILLDIYPKTNGTVNVTYGGLTKTITDTSGAAEPNAQQVFFGTFNGVSDSVETPASGTLTIEGDYTNFACLSVITSNKGNIIYSGCITEVKDWGNIKELAPNTFAGCKFTTTTLPNGITEIPNYCFVSCTNLAFTSLPSGITSIGISAFNNCTNLALTSLPSGLTNIGGTAFDDCYNLNIGNPNFFPHGLQTIGNTAFSWSGGDESLIDSVDSITIPETVTSIGQGAFCGPIGGGNMMQITKRVIMKPKTPPTLGGENIFSTKGYGSGITIVVSAGCSAAYKADETWIAAGLDDDVVEES